jgi:hypothetical protein
VKILCDQNKQQLFSADISQADSRELNFEQIDSMAGVAHREAEIIAPTVSTPVLRELSSYEAFNPTNEALQILRGEARLKNAQRLWQKMLQMIPKRARGRSSMLEPELDVFHTISNLSLTMSSNADELKGGGDNDERECVLAHLEREFGTVKESYRNVKRMKMMHVQETKTLDIWTRQLQYQQQLRPIDKDGDAMVTGSGPVTKITHKAYRSLLGGIAWSTQTMIAICGNVAALQRLALAPTISNDRKPNRLRRWIRTKRNKSGLLYQHLYPSWRIAVVSETAFQAQVHKGLTMQDWMSKRTSTNTTLPTDSASEGSCPNKYARKHTHVVESTFVAELDALLDAVDNGITLELHGHGHRPRCLEGSATGEDARERLLETCSSTRSLQQQQNVNFSMYLYKYFITFVEEAVSNRICIQLSAAKDANPKAADQEATSS